MQFIAYYYDLRLGNIIVYFTADKIDFDRTKRYLCYDPVTTKEFNILGCDLNKVRLISKETSGVV
jgi:hypothetical protein